MQGQGQLEGQTFLTGNPHAVRIVATAPSESAWEYMNPRGEWCGTYTEALVKVEGPETRVPFSLRRAPSCVLQIKIVNGQLIIQGGSVLGVRIGNTYTILTNVAAFKAKVKLTSMPSWLSLSNVGALAVLKRESIDKHPIQVPESLPSLQTQVEESTLLRCHTAGDNEPPLLKFRQEEASIMLLNKQGVELGSSPLSEEEHSLRGKDLIVTTERLVRAQRVLSLKCDKPADRLDHKLYYEIGVVEDEQPKRASQVGGEDYPIVEKEFAYVKLHNKGPELVYMSVFDMWQERSHSSLKLTQRVSSFRRTVQSSSGAMTSESTWDWSSHENNNFDANQIFEIT
ncbi:uncharacterized protein KD926_002965 [Aspergillus affinis]|uniref:uncharacterized protein n=1 Tax=Aspergillus affinis TaxID=1070780 RepID=UPI0022FF10CE|nr:uncharacterized protein KD926_002965 [Aspergillus affinis]KAI9035714.1 hypothetical protein KD926_002965 [Aspergillus affinis]